VAGRGEGGGGCLDRELARPKPKGVGLRGKRASLTEKGGVQKAAGTAGKKGAGEGATRPVRWREKEKNQHASGKNKPEHEGHIKM